MLADPETFNNINNNDNVKGNRFPFKFQKYTELLNPSYIYIHKLCPYLQKQLHIWEVLTLRYMPKQKQSKCLGQFPKPSLFLFLAQINVCGDPKLKSRHISKYKIWLNFKIITSKFGLSSYVKCRSNEFAGSFEVSAYDNLCS